MSTHENEAIARRWTEELFNEGNLDVADEIVAPNFVLYDPNLPNEVRGPEGIKQAVVELRRAFPDMRDTIEDMFAQGDKVAYRWTSSGTQQGELRGIPPTGRRVSFTGIGINRFENGKVVERWDLWDALGVMRQLGAVPEPGEQGGS